MFDQMSKNSKYRVKKYKLFKNNELMSHFPSKNVDRKNDWCTQLVFDRTFFENTS